jgi:hypothetical protein
MTATAGAGRRAAYLPLRRRWARQPALGLAGLTLVIPPAVAACLFAGLRAVAGTVDWTRGIADQWVAHVGLDAIGVRVILHVGIGLRWPFEGGGAAGE